MSNHPMQSGSPILCHTKQETLLMTGPFLPVTFSTTKTGAAFTAGGEKAEFTGQLFELDADRPMTGNWSVEEREFLIFSLDLQAAQASLLRNVTWFAGSWDSGCARVVNSTNLSDMFLFLRKGSVSFFLSLDFPFSRITDKGISYPPHDPFVAGQETAAHSLTVGACRLTGKRVGDFDQAEIEAASAYVERRHPMRFERPMFVSAGITNRMTECREGRVFYNLQDNPTIALSPELVEADIRVMAEIGVEYLQLFEGVYDWPDEEKTGRNMERIMAYGRQQGVKLGDYVVPEGPHVAHFNYSHRVQDRIELRQRDQNGNVRDASCLACSNYLEPLKARLLTHNRRYREQFICLDGLRIAPCYAEDHGHPPGDVYQQVRALMGLMAALESIDPDYLVWSNEGAWIEFMPKLTWHNPNVYLTDPAVREYESTLNQLKMLADNRREQMVTIHERHFVPYRCFCNYEYYLCPRSRVSDVRVFEYSFLQGLAVTPNIAPGEVRTFLNRLPASTRAHCVAFMRQWLDFIRTHFDAWKRTIRVGDRPGVGASEVYAHPAPDGANGYICLVNQNPFPREARFRLDSTIGLSEGQRFTVREVYPQECPIAEQALPFARLGDELRFELAPHSVRYLSVAPYVATPAISVYGHATRMDAIPDGYRLTLHAPQGETVRLGVVLPPNETLSSIAAHQTPTVPMYTFPVTASVCGQQGNLAWIDVALPRGKAPRAVTQWRVQPGDAAITLPQSNTCGFLGALIHGAYSEEIEAQVELVVTHKGHSAEGTTLPPLQSNEAPSAPVPPAAGSQIFIAEFDLPFIEIMGFEPTHDDDTVIELAFIDPTRVVKLTARLNGQEIDIRRYHYPRDKRHYSFYIELTGNTVPGLQKLEIEIQW